MFFNVSPRICGVFIFLFFFIIIEHFAQMSNSIFCFFFFLSTQAFAPEFRERMTQLGQLLKQLERADPQREILTAGEPEHRATVRSDREVC